MWKGTVIGKSYRNPFVYLANGDKIRVEGEDKFRSIKQLPSTVTSKDGRNDNPLSGDNYAAVSIETYTGVTRGEGLSVVAIMEKDGNGNLTGKIERLEWNQRSYDPLTQPTAYQYYTPPVIKFIPKTGNGGGARANVLVSKGQIISVDLIDGGSEYVEAPLVVVSRRYEILTERDIGVSLINVSISPYVETGGIIATSTIDLISFPEALSFASSAVIINSPTRVNWELEEELNLKVENKAVGVVETRILSSRPNPDGVAIIDLFTQTNQYLSQVSGRVADIVSNSVVTASRQITTTLSEVINNTALSNVNYYEVGAYLEVDLDVTDTVVYIADTSKFKTNGYLLIGDEVVRYYRKLGDRFIKVQRGENNTTAKQWIAGTFLRQIPDPVSVVPGGVVVIESESGVTTISASTTSREVERQTQRQISSPTYSIATPTREIIGSVIAAPIQNTDITVTFFAGLVTIESGFEITVPDISSAIEVEVQKITTISDSLIVNREIIVKPPESGAIDRYVEEVFFAAEVVQRSGVVVPLVDKSVTQRSGTVVSINNFTFVVGQIDYRGDYTLGKLGPSIGNFADVFVDSGTMNASGIAIGDMEIYFSALTIGDFTDRASSSYMKSGRYFTMVRPSINNPVTITTYNGAVPSVLPVQNTDHFPSSGYIFTSGGTVIRYTSKSNVTFNGCVLYSGPNTLSNGQQIIPFSIS